jgi:endonuclease YncB( thermonuclease family)
MRLAVLVLSGVFLAGPALAMPLPDCAGEVAVANAHVVRVEQDGTLILNDGHAAILEGIRLPGLDRPVTPVAGQALDALRQLTVGQKLVLTSTTPQQDRYGRLRAQAFDNTWLQVTLLERGLARVQIAPDREECAPDLYEAEARARSASRGLWALPRYAVRQAVSVAGGMAGSFQLVEGKVANVGIHDGRAFLDFNDDYRQGFSATVAPEDRKAFRAAGFALEDLAGRHVRLRGVIEEFGGRPEIALSNPYQIEIIP